ncbi:methyltransferase domain-containing protein, partial [Okeania sp. SIO2B3]|uniref:methyltransferase domain-containing protein n=1 Tax=Okeania sp. SIO2B3 TaxID=2607784 RepID=UPI0025FF413B
MLKILHIIQQLSRGGAGRSMVATAKYSSRMGVVQQHRVLSLLPAETEAVSLGNNEGMYVINQPNQEIIWSEIEAADIVHIHFWNNPEIYELLCSELPAMRLVFWFKIIGDRAPHIITKELLEYADFSIVTSPYTLELPVFESVSSTKKNLSTSVVYGIADFDRLDDFQPQFHETFNVGYIGTVDFAKMYSNYVGMSAKVNIPNVKFIVCGGINNYLRKEAEKLGAVERFEFRSYVENIKSVLEVLDVFGYPLCEDTYATSEKSLQEAMWVGVPPVVFPFGGIKRLVIHNQTGLVVNNETEYKNAIEYLYFHPEERMRLGRNAQEYARQNFSPESSTNKINEIYDYLLKQPKIKHQWDRNKLSGAELFIQSLGETAENFSVSMKSENISELLFAENQISHSSPVLCNRYGGGIFHYRDYYLKDGYLRLWSGLVLQKQSQHHQAISEFTAAINLGCNNWRVGYYLAISAEKVNDFDLAEKVLRQVLQKAPSFTPATEILQKILGRKEVLPLSRDGIKSKGKTENFVERKNNISPALSEPINTAQLSFQRQFWNVNSLEEAMFERVFTDEKINGMSPSEKNLAWQNSILSSTEKIIQGIPIKSEWKVLEIGCGVGRLIQPLRKIFAQVDGVDISENMIQFARQYLADGKQNGEVYVNNGCDLQALSSESYDFVYSTIVFQHIRSISIVKSYFREIFRVLKPGGYFRIQVHDHSAKSLGNFDEEGSKDQQYYFSGNAYTEEQLKDLLLEAGFNLVSLKSAKPWIWATVKRPEKIEVFREEASQSKLESQLISIANSTVENLVQNPSKIAPINDKQLELQRQFWNVNSIDEAMFGRVLAYEGIETLSPEEKKQVWEKSIQTWIPKIMGDIPVKPEWKVLEIGCGVGRLIKYLRETFARVDGVDISENMIQFARQYLADGKQNGEVYVNNGYDLQQLPDEYYDFVYSTIVFQHIRSISIVKSYFSEIFRVLKPGGYFRIQVHDHSAKSLGNFDEEGAKDQQYYFSGNAYTEEQLKDLLLEVGFNLVSLKSVKPWIWATVKRPEKIEVFREEASQSKLESQLISMANSTVENLVQNPSKIAPINDKQLELQRQFWNVNSIDEAMFGRVLAYEGIETLSPEEKKQVWEKSIQTWIPKIMGDIPVKPEWKVLEIGCGVGRLIKYLRETFARVDGVDISENMIQFARQYLADGKQNGEVYVNNGYDLQQLPDEYYDFVYSTIVFQHIRSISIVKSYFSEIFRVLKPGGYFRIQVHDHSAKSLGNFDEEGAKDQQYYFSGNAYTEEQLKDLLLE